jgi:Na+/H+-dicarboxylate symporter
MKISCCLHHPSYVFIAFFLGIIFGFLDIEFIHSIANVFSTLFIRLLKLLSLPVITFALLSTLSSLGNWKELQRLGSKVVRYTFLTTIIASFVAFILFYVFAPKMPNMENVFIEQNTLNNSSYMSHLMTIIPDNILSPFVQHNVIGGSFYCDIFWSRHTKFTGR